MERKEEQRREMEMGEEILKRAADGCYHTICEGVATAQRGLLQVNNSKTAAEIRCDITDYTEQYGRLKRCFSVTVSSHPVAFQRQSASLRNV